MIRYCKHLRLLQMNSVTYLLTYLLWNKKAACVSTQFVESS